MYIAVTRPAGGEEPRGFVVRVDGHASNARAAATATKTRHARVRETPDLSSGVAGGGYGGYGGGAGAGGGDGDGVASEMDTHADPTPFPAAPPSHTLVCRATVTSVPLGKVTLSETAGAQGIPFSAPYLYCVPPPSR
jgi:hypothetical protein